MLCVARLSLLLPSQTFLWSDFLLGMYSEEFFPGRVSLTREFCIHSLFLKFPDLLWAFPKIGRNEKSFLLEEHFVLIHPGIFPSLKDERVLIFLVELVRLKCCRRWLSLFSEVLPFDLLTVWLVVFLCHLCCCCVWKCWRRGILLWFPALPLGDCLFLARNTVEKGYQPLWTSLINLSSTSLNISKVYFWALVLSSTCFRSWWPNSSVCLSITVRHCYLKVSNFEFSDTFNIFKSRKHCYLPDLAA